MEGGGEEGRRVEERRRRGSRGERRKWEGGGEEREKGGGGWEGEGVETITIRSRSVKLGSDINIYHVFMSFGLLRNYRPTHNKK